MISVDKFDNSLNGGGGGTIMAPMNRFFNTAGPCAPGKHDLLDACGATEGWLVIFDRRPRRPWSSRVFWRTVKPGPRAIHVVGA